MAVEITFDAPDYERLAGAEFARMVDEVKAVEVRRPRRTRRPLVFPGLLQGPVLPPVVVGEWGLWCGVVGLGDGCGADGGDVEL
ncbi:hypothetical protein, partial [Streptomyces sp. NPDC058695]|uniref:hypothetical protein n=1 Tax=Streptomyces sp. NPDC058695 TaxID=3346604 RepID=UPI003663E9D9